MALTENSRTAADRYFAKGHVYREVDLITKSITVSLDQLASSIQSWWRNSCLSIMKFGSSTEASAASSVCGPMSPSTAACLEGSEKEMLEGEKGEGKMWQRSRGTAGLNKVRSAGRKSTNQWGTRHHWFHCSQKKNTLYNWPQVLCVNQKYLDLQSFILMGICEF